MQPVRPQMAGSGCARLAARAPLAVPGINRCPGPSSAREIAQRAISERSVIGHPGPREPQSEKKVWGRGPTHRAPEGPEEPAARPDETPFAEVISEEEDRREAQRASPKASSSEISRQKVLKDGRAWRPRSALARIAAPCVMR